MEVMYDFNISILYVEMVHIHEKLMQILAVSKVCEFHVMRK